MNKSAVRKAEFLACLSGISWQIRVNRLYLAFLGALNISAWLLSFSSLILILACIMQVDFMPLQVVFMLSGLLAVYCLATVIFFLIKPVPVRQCIELADSRTNRYNLIQNAFECCLAGRDTLFARATIESGLDLLKQNKDMWLALPYKRPGWIVLMPLLLIGIIALLPDNISGNLAERAVGAGAVLSAGDDAQLKRHGFYLSDESQSSSANVTEPVKLSMPFDFMHYLESLKKGSGQSSGYNAFNSHLSGGEYGLMGSVSEGFCASSSDKPFSQEMSAGADILAEKYSALFPELKNEFYNDNLLPGDSGGNPALTTDLKAAGRSVSVAQRHKGNDKDMKNKSSGVLQRQARPYLADRLEEPVRSLGFANNKKDYFQKGYGGIVIEKRPKADVYGIGGDPLRVYIKGISQNGNEQILNGYVPGGEFELTPQVGGQSVPALQKQPVDNAIVSEQWLDISKEYFKLVRQGIELKEKQ
ncbi:MAG: hypothetical protein JW745_03360 [Sedimentisphaerales bacterium]|nr:hypothetical protein [Sedimentisphaerales bacterium]MBN2844297.1 hypothetical protein [Sedimentisphaerales bacterium]